MGSALPLRRLAAALPLALSTLLLGACSAPTAKVMPFVTSLGIAGDLSIQDNSSMIGGATANSSFDELGVGDDEAAFGGLARIGLGAAELSVAALGIDFEGTGTTTSTFEFGGNSIGANVAVDTDIELQMARALFTWDLVPIGGVDLGIGVGATLLDLQFNLEEQGGLATINTEATIPVPLIGARAAWEWGPVDLRADIGGLVIEYDGDEATVIDGELSAAVEFLGVGDLVVGYRLTRIDAQYEDEDARVDANFDLEGYYFGLQLGF